MRFQERVLERRLRHSVDAVDDIAIRTLSIFIVIQFNNCQLSIIRIINLVWTGLEIVYYNSLKWAQSLKIINLVWIGFEIVVRSSTALNSITNLKQPATRDY